MNSLELLDPFLTPEMKAHPAWRCWLKHVELVSFAVRTEYRVAGERNDIKQLDKLVLEHQQLFDDVCSLHVAYVTVSAGNSLTTCVPYATEP